MGIHLMLTGDMFIFEETNTHHSTIVELYFEGGKNLALTDRMRNAHSGSIRRTRRAWMRWRLDYTFLKKY